MTDRQTNLQLQFSEGIATLRLKLRPINTTDVSLLSQLWINDLVRKHLGGTISPAKAKQQVNEYVNKVGYFCVTLRQSGLILGFCSLNTYRTGDIEVSYQFFPEYWGNGFGLEAITAVFAWGFENMNLDHIIAVTQKTNIRSRKILEKVGMSILDEFTEFNERQVMYSLSTHKNI